MTVSSSEARRVATGSTGARSTGFGAAAVVVLVVVAADRRAELTDPLADLTPERGQPLRPEDDQHHDQDDEELGETRRQEG